jgi:hypothetical protein
VPKAQLGRYVDAGGLHGVPGVAWIQVRVGYDPGLVAKIKGCFHPADRRWLPDERIWLIMGDFEDDLLAFFDDCGYEVVWDESVFASGSGRKAKKASRKQASAPKPGSIDAELLAAYSALEIAPHARYEVAKAAYRALCLFHHPDRGGSHAGMQRLNESWQRICAKLGRQA